MNFRQDKCIAISIYIYLGLNKWVGLNIRYFIHLLLLNKSVGIFLNKCKLRQGSISYKIVEYCISIKILVMDAFQKKKTGQKSDKKIFFPFLNEIYIFESCFPLKMYSFVKNSNFLQYILILVKNRNWIFGEKVIFSSKIDIFCKIVTLVRNFDKNWNLGQKSIFWSKL